MSIATQITALQADKTAIANAITTKGGTVGAGDGFDDFATDIGTIPTGPTMYANPILQAFNYGSEDANTYFLTGKKNLQQTEQFGSSDGKATIWFAKSLMGDALPEDVTAGKIFTSASGIQSVGTRQEGPTLEYFQFDVTDSGGGWASNYAVDTEATYAEINAARSNGNLPVAYVTYGDSEFYVPMTEIDTQNSIIRFGFVPTYTTPFTLLYWDSSNWIIE